MTVVCVEQQQTQFPNEPARTQSHVAPTLLFSNTTH